MSKKCISCGVELDDNANFCDECGTQQTVEALQTSQQLGKKEKAEPYQEQGSSPQSTQAPPVGQSISMPSDHVSTARKNSVLNIVSLLMGVVGVCTMGVLFIPEILGLIFGVVAVKDRSHKSRMAVVGIVLSVIALVLGILAFIGSRGSDDGIDQTANIMQQGDEAILAVKEGAPYSHPDQKFGETFESFFRAPAWKYFVGTKEGPDEDGDGQADYVEDNVEIVEFTGYCMYENVEVRALIQFTLGKDDETFEATYLSINEVPQSNLMLRSLLEAVFAEEDIDESGDSAVEKDLQESEEQEAGAESLYPEGMSYSAYDIDPLEIAGYYYGLYGQSTADISIYSSLEGDEVGNIKLYLDSEVPVFGGMSVEGQLTRIDINLYSIETNEFFLLLGVSDENGIFIEVYIGNIYVETYMMAEHYVS